MKKKRRKRKRILRTFFLTLMIAVAAGGGFFGVQKYRADREKECIAMEEARWAALEEEQERLRLEEEAKKKAEDAAKKEEEARKEEAKEPVEDSVQVVEEEILPVVMAFGGDICFYDAFANMQSLKSRGGSIDSSLSADLLARMRQADILMLNNEFAYSDRGTPLPDKTYTFCSKPSNVSLLKEMGVDIVSLANNHVYDYGEEALLDTLQILREAGMPYVGAGSDLKEASAPYYFEINGRVIAYVSATQVERNENPDTRGAAEMTPGAFRCFSEEEFGRLLAVIEESKKQADITVVYIHWGTENTDELHWAQEAQAPRIVEAGADLIVGDHPHCLQGIEYIKGVPVFYSLGNFWFNSKSLDTGLLEVTFDEDGALHCRFLPALQHDCRTDLASGEEKRRILQYLQCISPNVTIDEEGNIADRPYDGPKIDYDAVSRLPAPPPDPALQQPQQGIDPSAPQEQSTAQGESLQGETP